MISTYGYITGGFNVDPDNDVLSEIERLDDSGEKEYLISIETNRNTKGLNIKTFNNSIEYSEWLIKNGVIE